MRIKIKKNNEWVTSNTDNLIIDLYFLALKVEEESILDPPTQSIESSMVEDKVAT